jgi:acetyl esterase/lipase
MNLVTVPLTKSDFVAVSVGYRLFDPKKHPDNIWPAQADDAQRAVRFLRANAAQYGIDPTRIGAVGFSAGGHLASLLGTTDTRDNSDSKLSPFSSRVQCVVDVFGPSDLTMDYSHLKMGNQGTVQDLVDDFMGRGRAKNVLLEFRRQASPLFSVDKKSVPHFIVHGDKDPIVPVENSRKLDAALKKQGVPCEYLEIPGEGHTISPQHLPQFVDKMVAFFKAQLSAASAKPASTKAN